MTSETDAEFVERMAQELDYGLASFDDRRLFALARRGAAAQWRPIEEAPGQTMRVLLFSPGKYHADWNGADYGITVAFYAEGEWRAQGTNHDVFEYDQPAHWMPLPPPPKGAEE